MIHAIMVENLRSLQNSAWIDLKPITILLGANSSGKSTFLRFLPLLRQSAEARTMGPILWNGRFVDFGSFEEAVSYENNSIGFAFRIHVDKSSSQGRMYFGDIYRVDYLEDMDVEITVRMGLDKKREFTIIRQCTLAFADQFVEIELGSDNKVTDLKINGSSQAGLIDLVSNIGGGLVPRLGAVTELSRKGNIITRSFDPRPQAFYRLRSSLISHMQHFFWHRTNENTISRIADSFGIGSNSAMLYNFQSVPSSGTVWKRNVKTWNIQSPEFIILRDLTIA
jgi:hypothetical protein